MSKFDFKDKVALVTGSGQGIGKQVAFELCKKGAVVVINDQDPERLNSAGLFFKEQGFTVTSILCDVGNYSECQTMIDKVIKKHRTIDILINNAGLAMEGNISETEPEVFRKVIHVNILGYLYPTQTALPFILESEGSIIFNGSIAGLAGLPGFSGYSISKMAITALAQSLRIELKNTEVHVGINYLGFTQNEKTKTFYNNKGELQIMLQRDGVKLMPVSKVANRIITGVSKRRKKQVLSVLGNTLYLLQRCCPWLVEIILGSVFRKRNLK